MSKPLGAGGRAIACTPITITPSLSFTKSAYARHIGKSPTWVDQLIKAGQLSVIHIVGGTVVVTDAKQAITKKTRGKKNADNRTSIG